jgi:hypothetical protein
MLTATEGGATGQTVTGCKWRSHILGQPGGRSSIIPSGNRCPQKQVLIPRCKKQRGHGPWSEAIDNVFEDEEAGHWPPRLLMSILSHFVEISPGNQVLNFLNEQHLYKENLLIPKI